MRAGRLVAVLVAAVGVTAAGTTVAYAAPEARTGSKAIVLTLTVAKGEAAKPGQRKATLTCQPPGGSHKQARPACTALAKVGGDPSKLQLGNGACTMQYDPVTVTATGRWKGKKVTYQHTFGNACSLSMQTGPVFGL